MVGAVFMGRVLMGNIAGYCKRFYRIPLFPILLFPYIIKPIQVFFCCTT